MKRRIPLLAILVLFICFRLFAASPHNVLLISVDTLRADHLGCYGGAAKTSAFDSLAERSVLFEQAISQVPLTLPSHTTILTGLYPDQNGVRNNENFILPKTIPTIAEVFKQNGYATGAVVGSFSLDSGFGLNRGFDFYDDQMGKTDDPSANRYVERRAATVWKLGRTWLEKQKKPWFCFLHFFDAHTGYNPPPPFPQSYDGEIAYVNGVLQELLDYLRQSGAATNTIVVLLSDHGESLGEHGEASHGVFLYDATLHVPLMFAVPGGKPARVKSQVRLVDVAPTLVDLAGVQAKQFHPSGQSLVPLMKAEGEDRPAYSETFYTNLLMGWAPLQSLRSGGKKYISAPKSEFYDLLKDPREEKNLFTSESALPPTMVRELQKHIGKAQDASAATDNSDPELREKLMSLGYVTGANGSAATSGFDPKDGIAVWAKIETAVTSAQTGKTEESKSLFLEVLKEQPDNIIALKFLSNVLRKEGKNQEAIPYLEKALQSPLHNGETVYDLAETYYETKEYPKSWELISALVQQEPQNLRALKLAGVAAMRAKKLEDASKMLSLFLQSRPTDDEALSNYARVLSSLKQDQESLDTYAKLEMLRPLTEDENVQVAAIHMTASDAAGAEKYLRAAIAINAESKSGWRGLALIFAGRGQFSDAFDAFLRGGDCNGARNMLFQDRSLGKDKVDAFHKQCQ